METARSISIAIFLCGRVGEWLKPADCKSAAPCGLRRFESFPVHQALAVRLAENRRAIASSVDPGSAGIIQRDVRTRSDSGHERRSGKVRREGRIFVETQVRPG